MREIKFRAWVINPRPITFGGAVLAKSIMVYDIIKLDKETLEQYIPFGMSDSIEFMQFTGLKDKNGKDIYEGDIVEFLIYLNPSGSEMLKGKVMFGDGKFSIFVEWEGEYDMDRNTLEVVGNIYENKEMLE